MCKLRWWFLFCVSVFAFVVCTIFGWTHALWVLDGTKIGVIILINYLASSLFVGWLTYQAESDARYVMQRLVTDHLKACYLLVKSMVVLGIIGTTAGLLIMLNTAFGGDINPVAVLNGLRAGLSTLGITTLVGLICYLMLEVQVVNLEYALDF